MAIPDPTALVRLAGYTPDPAAVRLLPQETARQFGLVPLWLERDRLVVAGAGPTDPAAGRALSRLARRPVRALTVTYPDLRAALAGFYGAPLPRAPELDLGDILFRLGHLDEEALRRARLAQSSGRVSLAQHALDAGLIDEYDLAEAIGWQRGLPHVRLQGVLTKEGLATLIPWSWARERKVIPLWWLGSALIVGAPLLEPTDSWPELAARVGAAVWPVVCPRGEFNRTFERIYLSHPTSAGSDDAPLISYLLRQGLVTGEDLAAAEAIAHQTDMPVGQVLLDRELISRREYQKARAVALGLPMTRPAARPAGLEWPQDLKEWVPGPLARTCSVVPLELDKDHHHLTLGMGHPNADHIRLIESITGLAVEPRLLSPADLAARIKELYGGSSQPYRLEPAPSLGRLLHTLGWLSDAQLAEASQGNRWDDPDLGARLIELGYLDESDLCRMASLQTGLPFVRLDKARVDAPLVALAPAELLRQHELLPLHCQGNDLWVATADAGNVEGMRSLETATGLRVWPLLAPRPAIQAVLGRFFDRQGSSVDHRSHALIDALIARGALTQVDARRTLDLIAQGQPFDRAVLMVSRSTEEQIANMLAECVSVPLVDLQLIERTVQVVDPLGQRVQKNIVREPVSEGTARRIDLDTAMRLGALPIGESDHEITVAFADPLFAVARKELETRLGRPLSPCLAARTDLEEAIGRVLGRKNIGTRLLMAGVITRGQLNDALELAQRSGVRLGRALVNRGYVTQEELARFLAQQARLPFYHLGDTDLDPQVVRLLDAGTARRYGMLPVAADADAVTVAMVDPLNEEAMLEATRLTGRALRPVLVSEPDLEEALEQLYRADYVARSVSELLERSPEDSAYRILSRGQKVAAALFLLTMILLLFVDYRSVLVVLNALSTVFYLAFSSYKFYMVYSALSTDLEVPVSEEEVKALEDRRLPIYTILVPVFREAQVLPDLLKAIERLDYPTTKLDIKVLMEAEDAETIRVFREMNLPSHFQGLIIPDALPKTKPKACNYGLIHARGDYVVIFDAEDLPDPDQLKRVLIAFEKSPREVVCIQSKLNYYNRGQNLLTAWFTVEYSMWFDLFLPGLDASHSPIPLGGTSNHFRRDALIEAGAWDPYNVTEDADLGIRIFKRGYRTAIVDSTTYEEANSRIFNWVRQRSRWIKGYIQTWLVHMRHPLRLYREVGGQAFWSFQFVVGGTFFAALLNPVYWVLTTLWFVARWDMIREVFPGIIFYTGALCLYVGNFAFTYMNVAGAMRRGYYEMVKYALLSPLYWGLISIAAWKALWQLVTRPFYWEKTEHGLYAKRPKETP